MRGTDYGLDKPRPSPSPFSSNQPGKSGKLKFGKLTVPGDQIYVQVVGEDGVEVISTDFLKSIPAPRQRMAGSDFHRS